MKGAVLALAMVTAAPALAQAPEPASTGDLAREVRDLRTALAELADILRRQAEMQEVTSLTGQILALDAGVASLDEQLREAMREREQIAVQLLELNAEHERTRERMQNPSSLGGMLADLRGLYETQKERLALMDERRGHLETRVAELRETLRVRKLQRHDVEALLAERTRAER